MQVFGALLVGGPEYRDLLLFLVPPLGRCRLGYLVGCSAAIPLVAVASVSVRFYSCTALRW